MESNGNVSDPNFVDCKFIGKGIEYVLGVIKHLYCYLGLEGKDIKSKFEKAIREALGCVSNQHADTFRKDIGTIFIKKNREYSARLANLIVFCRCTQKTFGRYRTV